MIQSQTETEMSKAFQIENVCHSSKLMKNLLDIIESHPSESAVNFGRSIIYFIEDDYARTISYLELLIQKYPNIPLLHQRIAQVFIRENDYEKAILHLEKILELNEEDLLAKIWLSLSYFKVGNAEKAGIQLNNLKEYIFVLEAKHGVYTGLHS